MKLLLDENLRPLTPPEYTMAYGAKETEHAGPKKGRGAYWGRKADAKRESNRARREAAKRAVRQGLADSTSRDSAI